MKFMIRSNAEREKEEVMCSFQERPRDTRVIFNIDTYYKTPMSLNHRKWLEDN